MDVLQEVEGTKGNTLLSQGFKFRSSGKRRSPLTTCMVLIYTQFLGDMICTPVFQHCCENDKLVTELRLVWHAKRVWALLIPDAVKTSNTDVDTKHHGKDPFLPVIGPESLARSRNGTKGS